MGLRDWYPFVFPLLFLTFSFSFLGFDGRWRLDLLLCIIGWAFGGLGVVIIHPCFH